MNVVIKNIIINGSNDGINILSFLLNKKIKMKNQLYKRINMLGMLSSSIKPGGPAVLGAQRNRYESAFGKLQFVLSLLKLLVVVYTVSFLSTMILLISFFRYSKIQIKKFRF